MTGTDRGEEWYESLFEQTVARVRESPASFEDIAAIGKAAGVSRSALNDLFREHGHESPVGFLNRIRVEHVCRQLQLGEAPADAAASAGFESSSAFHQQFIARTGVTPGDYAALRDAREFRLQLPTEFRIREVLDFYGRDPQSVSERVFSNGLSKAMLIEGKASQVEITFECDGAAVRVDGGDAFAAHKAVVRMLGIDSDATGFERQFTGDALLGKLFARQRGLRIPLTPQPWEALAWAIMGQQISLKAAVSLRRELIKAAGFPHKGGLRAHPTPQAVASMSVETLRGLKFSRSKAEYLIAAAEAVANGTLPLADLRDLSARHAARLLRDVRGIGPWTIQYVFLRGFGYADCLPAGDAGLAQGLERVQGERPKEAQIREMMARFAPYRSFATYHIWSSLKGEPKSDAV